MGPNAAKRDAIRDVPQVRFARGVAGVAMAAALVASALSGFSVRSLLTAGGAIVVMLVLMTMVKLFGRVERGGTWLLLPAQVFVWVSLRGR